MQLVNVANRKKHSTAKTQGTSWKNKDKKKHPNSNQQVTEKTQVIIQLIL